MCALQTPGGPTESKEVGVPAPFGMEYLRVQGSVRTRFGLILSGKNVSPAVPLDSCVVECVTAGGHRFTALTHRGERTINDDRVAINTEHDIANVIDGHGTQGAYAAALLSTAFLGTNVRDAARNASAAISGERLSSAGVCVGRVEVHRGQEIQPSMSGDVKILVLNEQGQIVFESVDQNETQQMIRAGTLRPDQAPYHDKRHVVTHSISSTDSFITVLPRIAVKPGYRFWVYSDGVSDNLLGTEVVTLTEKTMSGRLPAKAAILMVESVIRQRIAQKKDTLNRTPDRTKVAVYADGFASTPREDNRAVLIGDIA